MWNRHRMERNEKGEETMNMQEKLDQILGKEISQASNEEIYDALLTIVQEMASKKERTDSKKKLYYISAEFLIGKLLSNNMINLGIYKEVKEILEKHGKNLSEIEEIEPEPSLGNGGLGRLAACFLDSIATLGLAGDGVGLNYHLGLFRQEFKNNLQKETPNPWIEEHSWLTPAGVSYTVPFRGFSLKSSLYDIDVAGYNNKSIHLHLFDIDLADESMVHDGISFNKKDILHNLTLFLYPDDSDDDGRKLRIFQQYFMVSNAAQFILDEATKNQLKYGSCLTELLKQPLGRPLSLHEQVITLCVATNKLMLDIDTKKIKEFQMDMLAFFDREHKEIGKAIDEKKVLDDELKEQILAAAKEFKERR